MLYKLIYAWDYLSVNMITYAPVDEFYISLAVKNN